MTIEERDTVKIPIKCPRCAKEFILDTEKWPPQRYCTPACSQYVRTKKWREAKKKRPDDSSGTAPAGAPEPHGDKPGS